MATVERRAPAAASSWEPKAARTPVTNGAANGSAAREQYTDPPSTNTGSGTGVQLLLVFFAVEIFVSCCYGLELLVRVPVRDLTRSS
jgi:hypothetical protein